MPTLFTITGLPRSGTAFLSTLFNLHPQTIGYHELAVYDPDWRTTITESECDFVADCSTYGFLPQAQMPSHKRVYIRHQSHISHERAETALKRRLDINLSVQMEYAGHTWAIRNGALIIPRHEVFSLPGLRRIWQYCYDVDSPFPEFKVVELLKLNIQHHRPDIIFGADVEFNI